MMALLSLICLLIFIFVWFGPVLKRHKQIGGYIDKKTEAMALFMGMIPTLAVIFLSQLGIGWIFHQTGMDKNMVKKFSEGIKIPVQEYKSSDENQGKVAIFDFDKSELIAEGENGSDWFELEMLCEELRSKGNYRIVIVPQQMPEIKLFRRIVS